MQTNLILLIDPENDTLILLRIILEREGYNVLAAHNGDAGIRLIDEWIPNLIFISAELTYASEFILQLKSKTRFEATKFGQIKWHNHTKISDAPFVIEKPIRLEQVLKEVSSALNSRS